MLWLNYVFNSSTLWLYFLFVVVLICSQYTVSPSIHVAWFDNTNCPMTCCQFWYDSSFFKPMALRAMFFKVVDMEFYGFFFIVLHKVFVIHSNRWQQATWCWPVHLEKFGVQCLVKGNVNTSTRKDVDWTTNPGSLGDLLNLLMHSNTSIITVNGFCFWLLPYSYVSLMKI